MTQALVVLGGIVVVILGLFGSQIGEAFLALFTKADQTVGLEKLEEVPLIAGDPALLDAVKDTDADLLKFVKAEITNSIDEIHAGGFSAKTLAKLADDAVSNFHATLSQAEINKLIAAYGAASGEALKLALQAVAKGHVHDLVVAPIPRQVVALPSGTGVVVKLQDAA